MSEKRLRINLGNEAPEAATESRLRINMQPDIGRSAIAATSRLRGSLLEEGDTSSTEAPHERALAPGTVIIRRDDGKPYRVRSINERGLVHLTDSEERVRISIELENLKEKLAEEGSAWHWP